MSVHHQEIEMTTLQSRIARGATLCAALIAIVTLQTADVLAQSHSHSRYSYQYSTPSDQHHWQERASVDFNT
jgi:hypothetical protein